MEPDYTRLGARLAERTAPLQPPDVDVQYDYAFGNLCEAMMRCYEQVASLVDPEDETYVPWQVLFDVNVCPEWALPWLAQVVGVRLPKSVTGDAAREYIKTLSFEAVGRPDTIKTIVTSALTGTKTVFFRERDEGDAYRLEIVTLEDETPDPDALQRAIEASVPAGILVGYRDVVGWDYQQMTTEGGLYSALVSRFDNYQNMSEDDRT